VVVRVAVVVRRTVVIVVVRRSVIVRGGAVVRPGVGGGGHGASFGQEGGATSKPLFGVPRYGNDGRYETLPGGVSPSVTAEAAPSAV